MRREVVVTGMGAVSPFGVGCQTLFEQLIAGRVAISEAVAACPDFDPEVVMTPKEARRADRFTQMAVVAAAEALDQAGDLAVAPERLGVIVGTGVGGVTSMTDSFQSWSERGERGISPLMVPLIMCNAAAATIAMRQGARGPCFAPVSACTSGAHSLGEAARLIERGDADVIIAGAGEAPLAEITLIGFRVMAALSKRGISSPFDRARDGFIMGEGSGILILEARDHAEARGAKILGSLLGYGMANDVIHITQPDASGRGALRAMEEAIADAGKTTDDIGYVNAHGTSTPYNDEVEALALRNLFAGQDQPPVSSSKGAIGHLIGAGGAVEAIITLMALIHGQLPPTAGLSDPDDDCQLNHIIGSSCSSNARFALSNSFAFGGHNVCLCLGRE